MRICSACGREYNPDYGWQKYCSPDCRKQIQLRQQRGWYYEHQPNPLPDAAYCSVCGAEFEPHSSQHRYCAKCSESLQREHKRKFTQRYRAEGREDRAHWVIPKEVRRERWQRYYAKQKEVILDRIRRSRYAQGQYPGHRSEAYWENRYHLIYELELSCLVCGTRDHLHVHHIVAVEDGGSDDVENLAVLCEAHHIGSGTGLHSLGAEAFAARYGIWLGSSEA